MERKIAVTVSYDPPNRLDNANGPIPKTVMTYFICKPNPKEASGSYKGYT